MRKWAHILRCAEKVAETTEKVVKEGRLKQLGNYVKNIIDDYRTVFVEIGQDMKQRPIKSSIYVSLLTSIGVLCKTNPGEREFFTRLTECSQDLMLVGDLIRNPASERTVRELAQLKDDNRLRCYNLGVCSILCVTNCGRKVALYSATSKYLKPHWTEFHKTIIDVGVLGQWYNLEKAMQNYDIDPEEWLEDGRPNKNFKFYKNNPLVSWDMKLK